MVCYHPVKGFRSRTLNSSGKRSIVFNASAGYEDRPVTLPCGQCIGCRLERSRQWAVRCMHEASLHKENAFITLTYNDQHLPPDRSVHVEHFQLFMKRLRKKTGKKVRFFHCGEYGDTYGRPHYHACLFGHDFSDKVLWKVHRENPLYVSESLNKLWKAGFSSIGEVNFKTAAYVARYVVKKRNGPSAAEHYRFIDPETGEVFDRKPEYVTMSRRPGIGHAWIDRFKTEVYPADEVIVNGKRCRPPKYYDKCFEAFEHHQLSDFKKVKHSRGTRARKGAKDTTPTRLRVREKVQQSRLELLKRSVD